MIPVGMPNELDALRDISSRLTDAGIPFMLTGSLAMSFYAIPRMTRDIDLVVELESIDPERLVKLLEPDYYVSREAIMEATQYSSLFNVIHRASVVKIDCIPRKPDEYHVLEFRRRTQVTVDDFTLWVVSREDLILSKLLWARDSHSEIQLADVRNLLDPSVDTGYVSQWSERLGISALWEEVSR